MIQNINSKHPYATLVKTRSCLVTAHQLKKGKINFSSERYSAKSENSAMLNTGQMLNKLKFGLTKFMEGDSHVFQIGVSKACCNAFYRKL